MALQAGRFGPGRRPRGQISAVPADASAIDADEMGSRGGGIIAPGLRALVVTDGSWKNRSGWASRARTHKSLGRG